MWNNTGSESSCMMAHSQEFLHIEIQYLKEVLEASEKKADRYAHLIATLSEELRNNICHACKKKIIPGDGSALSAPTFAAPAPTGDLGSSGPAPSGSFQRQPHLHSPVNNAVGQKSSKATPSPIQTPMIPLLTIPPGPDAELNLRISETTDIGGESPNIPSLSIPPGPDAEPNLRISETTDNVGVSPATNPDDQERNTISSQPESKLSKWSVSYNSKTKKALDLHISHVFTYAQPVYCAKMSPDGQRVAIGLEDDGKTYINDVRTGSNLRVLVDLYGIKDQLTIWCVEFSPDGQFLATAASDNQIRIWDTAKGSGRSMFKGHTAQINGLSFSPDGRSLASASSDKSIRIWKMRDGSSTTPTDPVNRSDFVPVAFSPDGCYIAAGSFDNALRIWDARTHKLVAKWTGHTHHVWSIAFTPDGKGLMSGSADNMVKFWDVSSLGIYQGRSRREGVIPDQRFPEILTFAGHTSWVRSIAFFPGPNQWVLTCSNDRSVRLWDSQTGVCQLTLMGHTDWVRAVDFSRTEKCLVTACRDHNVTVWKYEML